MTKIEKLGSFELDNPRQSPSENIVKRINELIDKVNQQEEQIKALQKLIAPTLEDKIDEHYSEVQRETTPVEIACDMLGATGLIRTDDMVLKLAKFIREEFL